jgi:hypothetical protein
MKQSEGLPASSGEEVFGLLETPNSRHLEGGAGASQSNLLKGVVQKI